MRLNEKDNFKNVLRNKRRRKRRRNHLILKKNMSDYSMREVEEFMSLLLDYEHYKRNLQIKIPKNINEWHGKL